MPSKGTLDGPLGRWEGLSQQTAHMRAHPPLLPTLHRRKPMQKGQVTPGQGQVTPGQGQAWSLSPSGPRRGCGWLRQPVPAAPGPPFLSSLVSSWVCWSRNCGQIPTPLTGQATIPPGSPPAICPRALAQLFPPLWHPCSSHSLLYKFDSSFPPILSKITALTPAQHSIWLQLAPEASTTHAGALSMWSRE